MPAKKPAVTKFKRDTPDLPREFESAAEPHRLFEDSELIELEAVHLQDLELPNLHADTFRMDGSLLERVQLSGGQFASAAWKDVRLVGCDLANLRAHRITLVRVEFIDCRLKGFATFSLEWQEVLIRNCDVSYAQLQGGKFRNCEFDLSAWQDSDLQESDLSGSVFRSCKLARTDLRGAKLQNTDFRKSELEGMVAGVHDVRGAIVEPSQALELSRLMGLQIV